MAMDKQELESRIQKADEKIEKINRRIAKWSKNMSQEAQDLCKRALNLDRSDKSPEAMQARKNHRDYYLAHQNDPEVQNPESYSTVGPNMNELWTAYSDLHDVLATKAKYEARLSEIHNFENEDKIPVLVEFLENWKKHAREFYIENAKKYFDLCVDYQAAEDEYTSTLSDQQLLVRNKYKYISVFKDRYFASIERLTYDITKIYKRYESRNPNDRWDRELVYDHYEVNEQLLDKVLEDEKKAKYKDLVARISAVAGTIQDCSDLHIAATGQLNGVVIGDKAHVNVETVGAGGYNIQKIPLSYASS